MSEGRYNRPITRAHLVLSAVVVGLLLFFKGSGQYYPEALAYAPIAVGVGVLTVLVYLHFDKNGVHEAFSDSVATWMSNVLVVLLISTINLGYFAIAQKAQFQGLKPWIFLLVDLGALGSGWRLREHFSNSTWLAYGMTSVIGVLFAAVILALT